MSGKAFFIDTTVCIGCRGCQVACKQWNQLPATKTENWGNYQNPKDLSYYTYKVVRFQEHIGPDSKPVWYFFPDQCRHCLEPACKEAADEVVRGGIVIDDQTGAVLYTDKLKKVNAEDITESCPFNIPKAQKGTGRLAKCTMCVDRVHHGLLPACVKTCPTGAMNFGDREKMVALAKKRLREVKSKHPNAVVTGLDDLRVFYLLVDKPKKYYRFASVDIAPRGMDRKMALRKIGKSLKELSKESKIVRRMVG